MELLQLRYFLAAAEYQHITRAAEHLQIAQPALSQAIHRLETELGMPLFERKSRSIVLNDAGKLLQKRLLPIMDALDRIPEELQEYRSQTAHTIHLRILAASALITNRIIAYRALRPDVNFQLYQAETHASYDLCVSAVRADRKEEQSPDDMIMLEEDLYLAVPANSPFGRKDSIRLSETGNAGYICLAGSRPIRQISNSYFAEAGISPRIIFESDTTESVRNLIAAGIGIGFWPQYSWGPLTGEFGPLAPGSPVKLLPITGQICRRQIILKCSPEGRENPVVMDFCRFLVENSHWLKILCRQANASHETGQPAPFRSLAALSDILYVLIFAFPLSLKPGNGPHHGSLGHLKFPETLLLAHLFFSTLQSLSGPDFVNILRPFCSIHDYGHTVIGYLNDTQPHNSLPPLSIALRCPEAQLTFLYGKDHGLPVGKDPHLTVMGRNHQSLAASVKKHMIAGYDLKPECRHNL